MRPARDFLFIQLLNTRVNADENQAVKWWSFEDALRVPNEPWMITHVYKKLVEKCK